MPPHVRRGGARGRSNTPRHAAQARADLSAGRSPPRTQGKFAAFDEFCKRLRIQRIGVKIVADECKIVGIEAYAPHTNARFTISALLLAILTANTPYSTRFCV